MTKTELRKAAKRGKALLDAFFPEGWMDRIDKDMLDLDEYNYCIVGQTFGPMENETVSPYGAFYAKQTRQRLVQLGIPDNAPEGLREMSVEYGFWPEGACTTQEDLQYRDNPNEFDMIDAWLELLNA